MTSSMQMRFQVVWTTMPGRLAPADSCLWSIPITVSPLAGYGATPADRCLRRPTPASLPIRSFPFPSKRPYGGIVRSEHDLRLMWQPTNLSRDRIARQSLRKYNSNVLLYNILPRLSFPFQSRQRCDLLVPTDRRHRWMWESMYPRKDCIGHPYLYIHLSRKPMYIRPK